MSRAFHSVPRPLLALWGAVAIAIVAWALLVPAWQSPDESQHFAYVQSLAERFVLPGERTRRSLSSEQGLAENRSRSGHEARLPGAEWRQGAFQRFDREQRSLGAAARRDGGGLNPAGTNPPLYYGWEALPYRALRSASIVDRLYAMRLWSGLLLLVTVTATWLLAGELLGRSRQLQLVAAAVAGFAPMTSAISASVNPDALLYALWSLTLWLGVRVLRRGLTALGGVALLAVVGLAVVTKATSYALLAPALLALAVAAWRARHAALHPLAIAVVLALLAFAIPAAGWVLTARALERPAVNQVTVSTDTDTGVPYHAANRFNLRGFVSYLRQFYIPQGSRAGALFPHTLPAYSVWFQGAWGTFAWRQLRLPAAAFYVLAVLSLCVLVAAAVALGRRFAHFDWAIAAVLALAVLGLLLVLHLTEYRIIFVSRSRGDFNQGRYLLPLIGLGAVAVAAALSALPGRLRAAGAGTVLGGIVTLQLLSLGTVAEWFYG